MKYDQKTSSEVNMIPTRKKIWVHSGDIFRGGPHGKKMPKIDTLDALEEHKEHDDDYQTITN